MDGPSRPHPEGSREHWALYYASRGWHILPLHSAERGRCSCGVSNCNSPGEHPRTQQGLQDATTDIGQIRRWWQEWPDANLGIVTGTVSGLVVINIDPENGGDASFEELRQQFPDAFREPLEVRTGSGGTQLYFECRHSLPSRRNIRPGVDVMADDDYVVAPSSLHVSRRHYRFVSSDLIVLLPAALRDLILGAGAQATGEEPPKVAGRNDEEVMGENGLSESPQEKSPTSVQAELKPAEQKPDRDNGAKTNGVLKPGLLIDTNNPDRTVARLRDILACSGALFYRGVPVRCAPDMQNTVAQVMTPDAIVLMAHQVSRPHVLRAMRDGTFYPADALLPRSFAAMYLGWHGEWQLPPLNGIASAPLLRDDGTITSTQGYDRATGMWCENVPDLATLVPVRPTMGDAASALRLIRDTFKTFCFADAAMIYDAATGVDVVDLSKPPGRDESSFLVALMTAACRPSLHLAPGVLLRAAAMSGAGSGKGLLARCICIIAFGRDPHAVTAGGGAEELEKRIASELIAGGPSLFLDNLNNMAVTSDLLASAITERPARVRLLGKSLMLPLNASTFVILNGNGLTVSEDLARRFVAIEFDPRTEEPEARPFKSDIRAEVMGRRKELLAAVLTIWRWGRIATGIKAGRPLGSFEQWSEWVRDPLLDLGCQDPAERISDAKLRDGVRQEIADLFENWWKEHRDQPVAASKLHDDVKKIADPQKRGRQYLASKLEMLTGTRHAGWMLTRQAPIGKWGTATYALKKTGTNTARSNYRGPGAEGQPFSKSDDPDAPYAAGRRSGNEHASESVISDDPNAPYAFDNKKLNQC
jgi:hypothetical protein